MDGARRGGGSDPARRFRPSASSPAAADGYGKNNVSKQVYKKKFFSFLPFLQGRPGGEHCFTQNSTDLTILAHMVWIEKQI